MSSRWYTGPEPCAGCGEPKPRYGKHSICEECSESIKIGHEIWKLRQDPSEAEKYCQVHIERYCLSGNYVFNVHEFQRPVEMKRIHIPYISDRAADDSDPHTSKEMRKAFQELFDKLHVGNYPYEYSIRPAGSSTAFDEDRVVIPVKLSGPIFRIFECIAAMILHVEETSYEKGKHDGGDLLGKLNTGEASMKDFEKGLK